MADSKIPIESAVDYARRILLSGFTLEQAAALAGIPMKNLECEVGTACASVTAKCASPRTDN